MTFWMHATLQNQTSHYDKPVLTVSLSYIRFELVLYLVMSLSAYHGINVSRIPSCNRKLLTNCPRSHQLELFLRIHNKSDEIRFFYKREADLLKNYPA